MIDHQTLTAVGGLLVIFGGAVRWVVGRMDAKADKAEQAINARISKLELRISELEEEKSVYLIRIFHLEGVLIASGIDLPSTEGWPP